MSATRTLARRGGRDAARGASPARGVVHGALTPLLDTLFLLLFALLALSDTRSATRDETVRVRLPEVEPAEVAGGAREDFLTLEVDSDSNVFLAGAERLEGTEELDRALSRSLGQRLPEEIVVVLSVDAEARHGVVATLLQHLRLRGFVNVELLAKGVEGAGETFGGDR